MSAISSFIDARVAQCLASMSFRQVVAGFVSRIRPARAPLDVVGMPEGDRRAPRQSDYERIEQRWDGSPYKEIRNQHGAWL